MSFHTKTQPATFANFLIWSSLKLQRSEETTCPAAVESLIDKHGLSSPVVRGLGKVTCRFTVNFRGNHCVKLNSTWFPLCTNNRTNTFSSAPVWTERPRSSSLLFSHYFIFIERVDKKSRETNACARTTLPIHFILTLPVHFCKG